MKPPTTAIRSAEVYQTAKHTSDRIAKLPSLPFCAADHGPSPCIRIHSENTFQTIIGFGGAFTEAGAYALSRMSPAKRSEVLDAYFHPETGSQYSLCRTHINSCDFSLGNYSYDDVDRDHTLEHFDISHDKELLIPFIRDAQALSRNGINLLASPWSPPAWMKTNHQMNHGGKLKPTCRDTWALYIAKYIQAYQNEGIDIWGVTVQNEPEAVQTWDSCVYTEEEERDFVKLYLGPTFEDEGLSQVKILIWDHNKDVIAERVPKILSDPDAAPYIWGIGFHWYTGDHFENLEIVHQQCPDKHLVFTEGCHEQGVKLGSWSMGERYAHSMIGDFNHWTTGWIDWNMVLNLEGGPNHVGNFCDAPIIADEITDTLHYQNGYYYIGHFSRFIKPGALRIGIDLHHTQLEASAFKNPDNTIVVVVLNRQEDSETLPLIFGNDMIHVSLPARSIQTVVWQEAV